MDDFIHWTSCYLLLLATCDEILLWMIEIWMKNYQGMKSNVGLTFNIGDSIPIVYN